MVLLNYQVFLDTVALAMAFAAGSSITEIVRFINSESKSYS